MGLAMIAFALLQEMFAQMRANTKWNIDGDMLWGYFFFDQDPGKLRLLAEHLSRNGYRLVSVRETDDRSTCRLHVERVETHTPETLHARNMELERVADEFCVERYDGMDVGPANGKD